MLFEIGRLCVKIAGRDARKYCVVIENLDKNYVMVDGETRRKKVNINHLEPLGVVLKLKKNASNDEVTEALKEAKISLSKKKQIKKQAKKKK